MDINGFLNKETFRDINESTATGMFFLTVLIFIFGSVSGVFVLFCGLDTRIEFTRSTLLVSFVLAYFMVSFSIWLFVIMKRNRILQNNWLFLVLIAPFFLIIGMSVITSCFTAKTVIVDGLYPTVEVKGEAAFYLFFIKFPLEFWALCFCLKTYVGPFYERNEGKRKGIITPKIR